VMLTARATDTDPVTVSDVSRKSSVEGNIAARDRASCVSSTQFPSRVSCVAD
jgi:hypothetical protein